VVSSSLLAVAAGSWGVVMALSPLLQIRTIVRNRSSADVSLGYLSVLLFGFLLWFSYGVTIGNAALIVPNVVSILASVATIVVVLHYRPRSSA
jgi:uncharacterized protein with PQ loop repeat